LTPKVFGIGFHKTGTTSLALALKQLGYSVTGPNGVNDPNISQNAHLMVRELVEKFDAFQDNPWPILFKELDAWYPNSKFVLTLREPESWIRSQVKHFGTRVTPMRTWIYGVGCPEGNEVLYLERFEGHNRDVLEHFRGRPNDLLAMDFSKGDGWEKLAPFLGKDVPNAPFPHANKAEHREKNSRLVRRTLGRTVKKFRKLRDNA
jgi:sulfotransferase family protein